MQAALLTAVLALPAAALPERPIVLHVLYNPAAGGDARLQDNAYITHVTNYTAGRRVLKVDGAADFAARLGQLKKDGVRVRQLIIDAHGSPASTQIMDADTVKGFAGLEGLFAPGAEILFSSCNTGKGDEGIAFMRQVGKTLLSRGGGRVTAAVDYVRFLPAHLRPLAGPAALAQGDVSLRGYLQLRVEPGGEGRLYYLPPGGQEFLSQVDTRAHQAVDLARFQVDTAADIIALQLRLAEDAARAARRTASQAAPAVRAVLPVAAPGLDLALRLFGR